MVRHPRAPRGGSPARRAAVVGPVAAALLLGACSRTDAPASSAGATGSVGGSESAVPATRVSASQRPAPPPAPRAGACRVLTAADVAEASNDTAPVDCAVEHTAQTYAAGPLPASFADVGYDDPALGAFAYRTCQRGLERFLGADESLALRTVLSWAWFRPDEQQWADGARWYRCDVVAGGAAGAPHLPLPPDASGLLADGPADRWSVCADGETVPSSPKVACSQPHRWRAVTTIKLGSPEDTYPGDRAVEVTTRDFCSDSVGAWLGYPADYDYGYTYFHAAEWAVGNRRSVCWARTTE